jgi:hypothetical protein
MNIWENNNKMNIEEIGTTVVNCICLVQVRDKWWALTNSGIPRGVWGVQTPHPLKF